MITLSNPPCNPPLDRVRAGTGAGQRCDGGTRIDAFTLGLPGGVVVTTRDWQCPAFNKACGGDDTTTDGERPAAAKLALVFVDFFSNFVDGV
jgi:hypothetical protein